MSLNRLVWNGADMVARCEGGNRSLDVFVSFSSDDREALVPVITELRRRGLSVWWSEDLTRGRWDLQISEMISEARTVLGIITPNAENSSRGGRGDYIIEELKTARAANKLVPIVIGDRVHSFAFRGVTALLQSYFFESIPGIIHSPNFEKIVAVCRGASRSSESNDTERLSSLQRLDRWYTGVETRFGTLSQIRAFSLALAIAVFENGPLAEVEKLGEELAALLSTAECDETASLDPDYPRRIRPLLTLLECEIEHAPHPVLGVEQTVVRFQDPERASALIQFAWTDFGFRRAIIGDWCREVVQKASAEGQTRVGFALGTLAQTRLLDVFEQILKPWLFGGSPHCQSVADIALSVAAFNSGPSEALRRIIENWAQRGTQEELAVAVKLACGFAGARIPGLAIQTLRTATRRVQQTLPLDLLETMRDSLSNLINAHSNDSDNSLFDLPGLISSLAGWVSDEVSEPGRGDRELKENPFPLLLFLLAVDGLPLFQRQGVQGQLSLDALIRDDETARLTAIVFNLALVRHRIASLRTREIAQAIPLKWIDQQHRTESIFKVKQSSEPLLKLARYLVSTAPSDDDKDRVLYLFESLYSATSIRESSVIEHRN
jgi:hypothetical protein